VFPARCDHLQELKPCFALLVNAFNVNVVGDGCPVRQQFVTNLSAVEMKLNEMQEDLSSGVASPKFGGPDLLTLSEQQCFVWDTVSQSTKYRIC